MGKRDVGDAKNTSLLKLGTLGDSLQSSLSLRSSAKKKWFLLQTLEPEKVSAAWGGASQVEASSGDFRVHYLLFLIDHFILLAAASQEALGPRKEPAGLLPGSDDRPADVLLSFWAKMLPLTLWTDLVDGTRTHWRLSPWCAVQYLPLQGLRQCYINLWRTWRSLSSRRCKTYTRWDKNQMRILIFMILILFIGISFSGWGNRWAPLSPVRSLSYSWYLHLHQLLFRYIEGGGNSPNQTWSPLILFH